MIRAPGIVSFWLVIIVSAILPAPILAQLPALPAIPANTFNVTNFSAIGDGIKTNTVPIQNTINAAFAAGGGTVEIPSGIFLCGPLNFSNNINLQLDSGAVLRMLPYGAYPGGSSPRDFIASASGGHDLEVSGTGTIDGQATASGWWGNGLSTSERPTLFYFDKCNRVLIENVTLENSPAQHVVFKGSDSGNITIEGITINTPASSPNTDGIDLLGTDCLVQNCAISDGDDCIALGSTSGTCSDVLVTNCNFGSGHGLSIGSNTEGGVSNLTVVNCTFNGTQYGIRLKSDNADSSPGAGGLVQNLSYLNLAMTNIARAPIVIYSYYNEFGTPTSITPAVAASQPATAPSPFTCAWRNVLISNLTATVVSGGIAGIVWGRTELPATNITLCDVNISAPQSFDVYNTLGFVFANSEISVPNGNNTFAIYNAGIILTNDSGTGTTLDGFTSTNSLELDNASCSTTSTDLFGADAIAISGGTLAVNNDFAPPLGTVFDFALGTNASTVTVDGALAFDNAVVNVTNAPGFGAGAYPLFTYTGSESGNVVLGSAPTNFACALTNTMGQIRLIVSSAGPSREPVNLASSDHGGSLQLSWPEDHIGWYLEIQTNSASKGLGTNWSVLAGSSSTNTFILPIAVTNGSVFLRLVYP